MTNCKGFILQGKNSIKQIKFEVALYSKKSESNTIQKQAWRQKKSRIIIWGLVSLYLESI